jgi:hypothetical protein
MKTNPQANAIFTAAIHPGRAPLVPMMLRGGVNPRSTTG